MGAKRGIYLVAFLCFIQSSHGYPTGAPLATCLSNFPRHPYPYQMTPSPFQTTLNKSSYSPSETIKLLISANISGHTLKGLQIRARPKYGDTERFVGKFTEWPTNKTKTLNCLGGENNMITHSNNISVTSIELEWTAPNVSVGDIEFVIGYVENFTTYWVNKLVELPAVEQVLDPPTGQVSPMSETIDWSECGQSKGCFLYPRSCSGNDCVAAATYKAINNSLEFETLGPQEGYIAVGFSEDKIMGNDEVIACLTSQTGGTIQRGYNLVEIRTYERQFKHGLFDIQGKYIDGKLYCRFRRPLSMSVYTGVEHTTMKHYDLADEYYVMLAWGPVLGELEAVLPHVTLPVITERKVSFQENAVVRDSASKQVHDTGVSITAWVELLVVCIAITVWSKY